MAPTSSYPWRWREQIAPRVNAMIAPVVAYGFTGILDAYPGSFTIPENVYRDYVRAVLIGLTKNKFQEYYSAERPRRRPDCSAGGIGPGSRSRNRCATAGGELVVVLQRRLPGSVRRRWRSRGKYRDRLRDGGRSLSRCRQDRYTGPEMATAIPAPNTWSAYPFPSSILLYKEGEGLPVFDAVKAERLFHKGERQSCALDRGDDQEMERRRFVTLLRNVERHPAADQPRLV